MNIKAACTREACSPALADRARRYKAGLYTAHRIPLSPRFGLPS
jgi:hypothetical protein